ncbi:accessory gene regulator ArgB-like protein [Tepidibacter formicigenes]|jgi:accessory gene regulator B|uniref:Accessory gene regulator B n=1 Tax=Tepidibacter formicigenes DSM 15518 TaxID=1123349 RepID=A0A1M6R0V7_9FIRM|nr:accessory gene regulator B family protein [Tepidibacter formicigenes]SHK26016.1 accessory gene regulator B [Tepidibacter formicigenes DSM 15518]
MYLIEKISRYIGSNISSILNLDNDKKEVIVYGAFIFIQTIWSIFLIILFGLIFNVLLESIIISFSAAFLRKYSGGAHATSPNRCAFIGVIIFNGFAVIISKITINPIFALIYGILSFLFTYYIIYKYAPVDTPSKPIKKEETKKRLKKKSIVILHILVLASMILAVLYLNLEDKKILNNIICICIGITWQSVTLTNLGHILTSKLDLTLSKLHIK